MEDTEKESAACNFWLLIDWDQFKNMYRTRRKLRDWRMRQQREAFEQKLMFVVFNHRRCFGEEIRWWRHGNFVMVQFAGVIRIWVTLWYAIFTRINAVPYTRTTRFCRAPTQWAVVHFAGLIVPQIRVKPIWMLNFFGQLLHRAVIFNVEVIVRRIR